MKRRSCMVAAVCWPAVVAWAQQEPPRPRHRISAAELHAALNARFPVRFGFPPLVEIRITAPALLLLPARNKLGATLQVEGDGPQFPPDQSGEMDVAFSLRYEAADQTLRAHEVEVLALRWKGVPGDRLLPLQRMLARMAPEAVGEIVLHKLTPRELALPDAMGLEPDRITVLADGIAITFGTKRRR